MSSHANARLLLLYTSNFFLLFSRSLSVISLFVRSLARSLSPSPRRILYSTIIVFVQLNRMIGIQYKLTDNVVIR